LRVVSFSASARPRLPASARVVREPLEGPADPLAAARWLRGEPRAVALSGAWAGGGLVLSSHPLLVVGPEDDPFAALDSAPLEAQATGAEPGPQTVGGGWLGWLGFGLARAVEPVPPPPRRPAPLPLFDLAFHDHLIRCDSGGQWWFEALWTDSRAALLSERRERWRTRLAAEPPPPRPFMAGPLQAPPPGTSGHQAAVAEAVDRIAAGEMSQANICLRLEGELDGEPLDLWLRAAAASRPAYAAYVGGDQHAILSLSPELFLRRRGRTVESRPIKGTVPAGQDPATLVGSAKDRAENVMIVDLMRNDLGRVCEFGTVEVPKLWELEAAAGVWHLVSTVRGRLRDGVGDGRLLRATFPPGSVTGAPKVQALRVISELEATAREAYCGAVGLCSPLSGLELNVAIRTFELRGQRLWLGAGGGVVSDSRPEAEVEEALTKARGIAAAAGIEVDARVEAPPQPRLPALRLARPDPELGVLETILVRDRRAIRLADHAARLRASCHTLGISVPRRLERSLAGAAAAVGSGGLRVVCDHGGVQISLRGLPGEHPTRLEPVVLPGGLGPHKWADRRLIDELSTAGSSPLLCDLDGSVLEAGYAAILIAAGGTVRAPALDGRLLDSVSRRDALQAARTAGLRTVIGPVSLAEVRAAEAIVLTSSLRGPHPGLIEGGPVTAASAALCATLQRHL
jgi:anthranilate/para-aminobenzoate synthase component I